MKPSKYGNRKCHYDGKVFDSKLEMQRYMVLRDAEKRKEIAGLEHHRKIDLIVNGILICRMIADFTYFFNGLPVVEDTKGYWTDTSRLKWKLAIALYDQTKFFIVKKQNIGVFPPQEQN